MAGTGASSEVNISESVPGDREKILALYPRAFPDEELRPLVAALLDEQAKVLSLTAAKGEAILGHVLFTTCGIEDGDARIGLLGPLLVDPDVQRQGIGGQLIRTGLEHMNATGLAAVCVLGDPGYYARFGFTPEPAIKPPFPIPDEWRDAWRSVTLSDQVTCGGDAPAGRLTVPPPWRNSALWGA